MELHPLTPRQPVLAAKIMSVSAMALVTVVLFVAMISILPPIAWSAHLDQPYRADAAFLVRLALELLSGLHVRQDPIGSLARLTDLPFAFISSLSELGIGGSVALRGAAALVVGIMIASDVRQMLLRDKLAKPDVQHVKGLQLIAGRDARRGLMASWAKRFGVGNPGIELVDGLVMPRALEAEHFLLVGGTGAGKTTILEKLIDGALARGDRLLALDVKGDVVERFPSDDFALMALGDARSAKWQLGLDIVSAEDAAELAAELIRETNDPSWSGGARQILTAIVEVIQAEARQRGKIWSWAHLNQALTKPIEELFALLREHHPAVASLIDVEREETRRQALSFYIVLTANAGQMARSFATMGRASGRSVSIRRWVCGHGSRNIILGQSPRQPELSAAMCRIVLKVVADSTASAASENDTGRRPIWLFLDELPQIGKSAAVTRLAAIGRSLGIRIVAAIQSPAQVREVYGPEGAQHLLDNLTTKIIGRIAGGRTASEISSTWIGSRTIAWEKEAGYGADGRMRFEQQTQDIPVVEPAFLATELGMSTAPRGKPRIKALVLGHGDLALLAWPVGRWHERRPATDMRSSPRDR